MSHKGALLSLVLAEAGLLLDWTTTAVSVSLFGIGVERNPFVRLSLQGFMLPWHFWHIAILTAIPGLTLVSHKDGLFEGPVLSIALLAYAVLGLFLILLGTNNLFQLYLGLTSR